MVQSSGSLGSYAGMEVAMCYLLASSMSGVKQVIHMLQYKVITLTQPVTQTSLYALQL